MEEQPLTNQKPAIDEAALRRRLAMDKAAVENRLKQNSLDGKKIGKTLAALLVLALLAALALNFLVNLGR